VIRLITGIPGHGKTLFAVRELLAETKRPLSDRRPLYSDIEGLDMLGVSPAPLDWRTLPDNAICVYDECQKTYRAPTQPGPVTDPRLTELETHRHRNIDLWFITQHPTFVHHHIRKLVDEHFHIARIAGAKIATIYSWTGAQSDPNDWKAQEVADKTLFKYPKALYKLYKSASDHSMKFRPPTKLVGIIVFVGLIFGILGYRVYARDGQLLQTLSTESRRDQAPSAAGQGAAALVTSSTRAETGQYQWATASRVQPINGCAASDSSCRCWDFEGLLLDLPFAECQNLAHGPLPLDMNLFRNQAKGASNLPPVSVPAG